ncbi:MAG: pyruvate kinase, partial [Anaerolineae bacterium]|nr:pyruvate kinase [Anaerolineae bacterium]
VALVRQEADRQGRAVAVLVDLQGRKPRLGALLGGEVRLEPGQAFALQSGSGVGDAQGAFLDCEGGMLDLREGDEVLLDDGALRLRVEAVQEGERARCRVEVGGVLREGSGVCVPGRPLGLPALRSTDLEALDEALRVGVDFLYFSYVERAADVRFLRRELAARRARMPIVAKVERGEALRNLAGILEEADGICLARGDLGVEVPPGDLPRIQAEVVAAARRAGKLVVLGGEVLQSMVVHPRPFRAEATDVAVAVQQGVDAIVLSDETAVGRDPVGAVQTLLEMLRANEAALGWPPPEATPPLVARSAAEALAWSVQRPRGPILLDVPPEERERVPWPLSWWGVYARDRGA